MIEFTITCNGKKYKVVRDITAMVAIYPILKSGKSGVGLLKTGRTYQQIMSKCQKRLDYEIEKERAERKKSATKAATPKAKSLSEAIKQQRSRPSSKFSHVIVEARAGTGKTTTLIEGLKRIKGIPTSITPSPQQSAVWDAMEQSKDAKSVCFVAFNKSIADELKSRVPEGCNAMTMHSMGFKAVSKAFGPQRLNVDPKHTEHLLAKIIGVDTWDLRRNNPSLLQSVCKLVSLCKMNLVGFLNPINAESLSDLASYYDVDLNGDADAVFRLVPQVLELSKDVATTNTITYDDMIWLPVVMKLAIYQYDLLLVDESQDLNRCQQELACMAGRRLILVGDPMQAIYGFAGADSESMSRMEQRLANTDQGCVHLSLTVTRRCGKAIVKEAQRFVKEFEAHESNEEGNISYSRMKGTRCIESDDCEERHGTGQTPEPEPSYQSKVEMGDMVLCRCNAPLVSECFRFLKSGRKANIQGRDIGQGLISTINKLTRNGPSTVEYLIQRLGEWLNGELKNENAKRNPSEQRLVNLQDRYDCLLCFCEDAESIEQVVSKIERIFTDGNVEGIRLSSVHKAKGLEARRVFILLPESAPMPHPMAKSAWERKQEMNIFYVAITRAIEELVYVN